MSEQPLIEVEASSTFNRNLRTLAKKYRRLVKLRNDEVTPRCKLYRKYLRISTRDNQKIM